MEPTAEPSAATERADASAPDLAEATEALLTAAGADDEKGIRRRLTHELVTTAAGIAADHADTLDLKIATAALREMREAFRVFAPYEDAPKVAIFGSARVKPDDPLYEQAREVASVLADHGWMVVTGAGPGIMAAGMEGAGRAQSIGVSIRLPFEQSANSVIAGDDKHVTMKYFFTRKLMLIKESKGFICLPGGFGTLDEMFELLTLTQTGKGLPVPIVLLEAPGDDYWAHVRRFVSDELAPRGLIDQRDLNLFLITDSSEEAVAEIVGFYANYDSIRYVGDDLVIRLRHAPTDTQLAELQARFQHMVVPGGTIERTEPLPAEVRDRDALELERIKFPFAKHGFGDLRAFIDALNDLAPPADGQGAPSATPD